MESVENVRDLGGIPVAGGRTVRPRLLYRGSALHSPTSADRKVLFGHLGITCVVDLRCGWEREAKPNAVDDNVEMLRIPFYDRDEVGIEYTEPAKGTKVVGRDVACDPLRFYRSLANPLTVGQMRRCVHHVLERAADGRPVYYHCSGGKDRAGVMSAVVLTVLGAEHDAIVEDYVLTNESRDRHYDQAFERFLRFAEGDEQRAHELVRAHRAWPETLQAFFDAVDERYGSMETFVREQLDVSDGFRAHVRERCTCSQA